MSLQDVDEKKALVSLSQFVFRNEAGKIREGLYDGVVELAIYTKGEKGILRSEISGEIRRNHPINLHEFVIDETLDRLARCGAVTRHNGDLYSIDPERMTQLSELINRRKEQIELLSSNFIQEVKSSLKREASSEDIEIVNKKLFVFLSDLLIPRSKFSAALLTGRKIELPEDIEAETVLKKTLSDVASADLKGALKKAFVSLFQKMDENLKKVLFDIVENLYLLEVLNIDPECNCLQRVEFSKIKFFIDTNTIIYLLCSTDPRPHKISSDFMSICRSLGTQVFVSDLTMSEYNHVLENSNAVYKDISIPSSLLGDYPDPFVSSYAEEVKQHPSETWEGYYLRMKRLGGDIEKVEGIKRFEYDWNELFKKAFFAEIVKAVTDCAKIHRGYPKHEVVARHDAAHLILVREMRKNQKSTIFGPNAWFASLDHTLICAEKFVDKYCPSNAPSTMNCDIWIQMIAPFLSTSMREASAPEIFSNFISSQFWVVRERVNYENLKIIQGDWLKYSRLNEHDLREILSEKFVKNYVGVAKGYIGEDKEIPEDVKDRFEKELAVKIDKILAEKIGEIENRLRDKEGKLKELEAENQRVKSDRQMSDVKTRMFWRQVAGVLGALLFLANIYLLGTGQMALTLYSVPYLLGSWLTICVLLMIAIAYERVAVVLKMIFNLGGKRKDE